MLVFAALAYSKPENRETINIDETVFYRISAGEKETFLKIRSAAHLYRPMDKPMAWIFTIARNVCLMKFRKQKHYSSVSVDELREIPDCSDIRDRGDRIVLETAFQVLTKEECQIIVLHAVSGMKHREISELLHLPLSTVLSRYNRSIKKLRRQLEGLL